MKRSIVEFNIYYNIDANGYSPSKRCAFKNEVR